MLKVACSLTARVPCGSCAPLGRSICPRKPPARAHGAADRYGSQQASLFPFDSFVIGVCHWLKCIELRHSKIHL
jgi:hypothetical protein